MKTLLVEGWRDINHSYAMVNQNQLLELVKYDFDLFHRNIPYYKEEWSIKESASGFDEKSSNILNSIPTVSSETLGADVTFRISFPYRYYSANSPKLFVFGTSEHQTINSMVYQNNLQEGLANPNLKIITPSNWSRQGFINAGFTDERVFVHPHGVSANFQQISPERRESFRKALGCAGDDFLLLSLGAMTENKGIDLLLMAYSMLKSRFPYLRLVLKDSSNLYGIKAKDVFANLQKNYPKLLNQKIYNSIIFISDNITQSQLNGLYGACDCYVSPYRAEGFNLGPLEAAASGSVILVTDGGSTDDYFHESLGLKIEGEKLSNGLGGFYIEPNFESLLEKLTLMIEGWGKKRDHLFAQEYLKKNYSWEVVVKSLVKTFEEH
jgi:glycosyltransferase involved in cell wall biosynthesis